MKVYEQNIKKRLYTLLIPYLLWNLIALALWECRYFANTGHFISDLRFILYSFWTSITKGGVVSSSPIDYPLWFVRDLMVISLLSPIVHYVLKHVKIAGLAVVGMLWLLDVNFNIPGLSSIALFFFSAGAYFSIHGISPLNIPFRKTLYLAYTVSVLGFVLTRNCAYGHVFENLNILLGIPVFLIVIAASIVRIDIGHNGLLNNSTFFIFALHALIIKNVQSCIDSVMDLSPTVSFFVVPSLTVMICICCYAIVSRYFPRIANILTGNRG